MHDVLTGVEIIKGPPETSLLSPLLGQLPKRRPVPPVRHLSAVPNRGGVGHRQPRGLGNPSDHHVLQARQNLPLVDDLGRAVSVFGLPFLVGLPRVSRRLCLLPSDFEVPAFRFSLVSGVGVNAPSTVLPVERVREPRSLPSAHAIISPVTSSTIGATASRQRLEE